ncbi:uncharacterized protein LOC122818751 [Drosophila biarmipes]|uniref:uncharacterized protein LOC122818751 n=1 Tax=Drosophila biarmipes TaxID=125945 RepID=UPI001CDB319F|nr:uncharacterized protein LOC122818751 [Drosophila biarmipes]
MYGALDGDSLTNIKYVATTTIQSRITEYHFSLEFCVTGHFLYQPDSEIDISSWNLPTNTPLADERFHESRLIDLLLGAEKLWELEAIAVLPESLHPHHQICEALYTKTTVQDSHGRIIVNLPFKDDSSRLGNSAEVARRRFYDSYLRVYIRITKSDSHGRIIVNHPFKDDSSRLGNSAEVARRRFYGMESRMLKFPELRSEYVSFMQEYQALGHMSLVTNPALHESRYYIPHHCVLKPSSTSTKLRVVFDASCTTTTQLSLNDLLLVGSTVQTDLYLHLLKFRLFQYTMTANVTKMYRQVLVDPSFRKYQYIFWRNSPDAELQTFQLNTVTYGTVSSSAQFTLLD